MKTLIALLMLLTLQSVFAQDTGETEPTETPEDQEQSRVLRCNVIRTPWYLKKSFDHAQKITSCWIPGCKIRHARKSEKYFCKAVHSCDSLNEYLDSPCTEHNRLTPEAQKDITGYLKTAVTEAINFVKDLLRNSHDL